MQNSRLVQALGRLTRRQFREMSKLVRSPFFNHRPEVIRLFDYLTACELELDILPEKPAAYRQVFPNEPYDDSKLRKCMTLLMQLLEQYLIYKNVFGNEVRTGIELAGAYRHLDLPKHFGQVLKNVKQVQAARAIRNADYFSDDYQIQLEEYEFTVKNRRIGELNLQKISDTIDIVYLSSKLRQTCFSLSHQAVYRTDYNFGLLQALMPEVERFLDIPAISIYYYCYRALTREKGDADFQEFKKLVFEYIEQFPLPEIRSLYLLALNFCIKRYNEGQQLYANECFDLYREGLERDFLVEDGILSRFTYNNIVSIALTIGQLDWAEQFIDQYKTTLEKKYQESNFSFNRARLLYERQDYEAALQLLQRSEYKDILLNLSARTAMIKIFYEIEAFDLLHSHLEALKTYINRKKVMVYHRINYMNVAHFARKLMELPPGDRQERARLRAEIEATKGVAEKPWLLRQLL